MKSLYLVDVSSFFFRAYYAIPPLNTAKGLPTNALYGFLTMTIKLLRDIDPDYLAFCFDRPEKSFRSDMYKEYKAQRTEMPEDLVPQVPYLKTLTDKLGISRFDKLGFEADDVIGSLTRFGREQNLNVVIVSGDKDFAQLVGPFVTLLDTMKDKKYDEQGVIEKWGVSAQQMIDYLALVGDSSDNVPGVKGIGPKGAQKLLAEFKTLDGVYKSVDKISGKSMKEKLIAFKEDAYMSQKLVEICQDIDFGISAEDLRLKPIIAEELRPLLEELEFKSFEKNLLNREKKIKSDVVAKEAPASEAEEKPSKSKASDSKAKVDFSNYEVVVNDFARAKKEIEPYSEIVAMQSPQGLHFLNKDKIFSFSTELEKLGSILGEKTLQWKAFDVKEIWRTIELKKVIDPAEDLMLMAYVIRAGNIDGFEKTFEKYTGQKLADFASAADLFNAFFNFESILQQKIKTVSGEKILNELELPLVPVLHEMETAGVRVDTDELKKQSESLQKELERLEKLIYKESGEAFNISSPKQLAQILFAKLKLPVVKKTKTGQSTDNEVLLKLASQHPICALIIDFREMSKIKSTYVDVLPQLIDAKTGKVHSHFRQAVTATGRLSSFNPNLQNIPIRTEIGRRVRQAFCADPGQLLLSVDYSQIELRVLAQITDDPALCKAFQEDVDVHAVTASEVFGISINEVTSELRRKAKAVNFGIAYGQGTFGLAETLGISRTEAAEIIGNYFGKFKGVKEYMVSIVESAKKSGYVETVFGRRRYLDELQSKNAMIKKFGERAAINAPIQGTASDLVKKAMITVHQNIQSPMLLQVHDELLFSCKAERVESQAKEIKKIMESVVQWKVPLKVNVAWGANWADAHA